jgi:hypothetical protein
MLPPSSLFFPLLWFVCLMYVNTLIDVFIFKLD